MTRRYRALEPEFGDAEDLGLGVKKPYKIPVLAPNEQHRLDAWQTSVFVDLRRPEASSAVSSFPREPTVCVTAVLPDGTHRNFWVTVRDTGVVWTYRNRDKGTQQCLIPFDKMMAFTGGLLVEATGEPYTENS